MTYRNLAAAALAAASLTSTASAHDAVAPHAPTYAERSIDADFSATINPGAVLTIERACPYAKGIGYAFTEVSTYRANGGAMGRQHFSAPDDVVQLSTWRYPGSKRHVTFNGLTWHNFTHHRVMVAGWCG